MLYNVRVARDCDLRPTGAVGKKALRFSDNRRTTVCGSVFNILMFHVPFNNMINNDKQ